MFWNFLWEFNNLSWWDCPEIANFCKTNHESSNYWQIIQINHVFLTMDSHWKWQWTIFSWQWKLLFKYYLFLFLFLLKKSDTGLINVFVSHESETLWVTSGLVWHSVGKAHSDNCCKSYMSSLVLMYLYWLYWGHWTVAAMTKMFASTIWTPMVPFVGPWYVPMCLPQQNGPTQHVFLVFCGILHVAMSGHHCDQFQWASECQAISISKFVWYIECFSTVLYCTVV